MIRLPVRFLAKHLILVILYVDVAFAAPMKPYYVIKQDETISDFMYQAGLEPMYGPTGYLKDVSKVNPKIKDLGLVYINDVVYVPAHLVKKALEQKLIKISCNNQIYLLYVRPPKPNTRTHIIISQKKNALKTPKNLLDKEDKVDINSLLVINSDLKEPTEIQKSEIKKHEIAAKNNIKNDLPHSPKTIPAKQQQQLVQNLNFMPEALVKSPIKSDDVVKSITPEKPVQKAEIVKVDPKVEVVKPEPKAEVVKEKSKVAQNEKEPDTNKAIVNTQIDETKSNKLLISSNEQVVQAPKRRINLFEKISILFSNLFMFDADDSESQESQRFPATAQDDTKGIIQSHLDISIGSGYSYLDSKYLSSTTVAKVLSKPSQSINFKWKQNWEDSFGTYLNWSHESIPYQIANQGTLYNNKQTVSLFGIGISQRMDDGYWIIVEAGVKEDVFVPSYSSGTATLETLDMNYLKAYIEKDLIEKKGLKLTGNASLSYLFSKSGGSYVVSAGGYDLATELKVSQRLKKFTLSASAQYSFGQHNTSLFEQKVGEVKTEIGVSIPLESYEAQ